MPLITLNDQRITTPFIRIATTLCFILTLGIECVGQTFGFSTWEIVIANNGNAQRVPDRGVLVIQKEGTTWKAQLTLGDKPGPIAHLSSIKVLREKGIDYVKGISNDINFEINSRQLTLFCGHFGIIFPKDALESDYQNQLANLMKALGHTASVGAKKTSTSGNGNNRKALLPTSGNLTAATFAKHPFGFMPQGPMAQSEACAYLRQAEWPSKPFDSSMMCIISSSQFKIPFKMYGKDVAVMTMFWDEGTNKSYDLCVSDYKTNWTKDDAISLAELMYDELIEKGYKDTEVKYSSSSNFYQAALTDGRTYIQIYAHEDSKLASLDAFGVNMKVQF